MREKDKLDLERVVVGYIRAAVARGYGPEVIGAEICIVIDAVQKSEPEE